MFWFVKWKRSKLCFVKKECMKSTVSVTWGSHITLVIFPPAVVLFHCRLLKTKRFWQRWIVWAQPTKWWWLMNLLMRKLRWADLGHPSGTTRQGRTSCPRHPVKRPTPWGSTIFRASGCQWLPLSCCLSGQWCRWLWWRLDPTPSSGPCTRSTVPLQQTAPHNATSLWLWSVQGHWHNSFCWPFTIKKHCKA